MSEIKTPTSADRRKSDRTARRAERRRLEMLRRQRRMVIALSALVVALMCLCGWRYAGYRGFQAMRAAVEIDTFFDGTHVEGIDVSGMTLEGARDYWRREIEPKHASRTVTLSDGTAVTAQMVGYSSDYLDMLDAAYASGRTGGLGDRYEAMSETASGLNFVVTRAPYSDEGIEAFVREFAGTVNAEPVAPQLAGFDPEKYEMVFTDGVDGKDLNEAALASDLRAAFDGGGTSVELDIVETPVSAPTDEYGVISYMITNASSSSSARIHNIRQSLKSINGMRLDPGQMFSFNEVVGKRTKGNGYREAKAYYGMQDILEYGGGICQSSSTLYAAALGANLQIDERHEHSRKVWYIKRGMDATVDWDHKDLKFTNNRDEPIYLACFVDGDKRVRVAIFGRILPGDPGLGEEAPQ